MVEFQTIADSPGPHAALALRSRLAGLRVMSAALRLHGLARKAGFDPNQPRVPRGHPDGGQWTRTGGSDEGRVLSDATPDNFWKPGTRVAQARGRGRGAGGTSIRFGNDLFDAMPGQQARFTAIDRQAAAVLERLRAVDPKWRPRLSAAPPHDAEGAIRYREAELREARERLRALESIGRVRNAPNLLDLLGDPIWLPGQGTVATSIVGGRIVTGVSSGTPIFTDRDFSVSRSMVDRFVVRHPDITSTGNIGQIPNDAFFHAEANLLMRAAQARGGTLAGERFVVHTDRTMCASCKIILPRLGQELGNPTVTFVEPGNVRRTMSNGKWIKND